MSRIWSFDILGLPDMTTIPEPDFLTKLDSSVITIVTALSDSDRRSFLRVQQLVRREIGEYSYLEIGSEQGASLQPHLLDPACTSAVSIDLRPQAQPDERGLLFHHIENSTERMRQTLTGQIGSDLLLKLTTFDSDADAVPASALPGLVDLVMIDAEHTNTACFSDFVNVLAYVKQNSVIAFHDANLILDAIQNAERMLRYLNISFETVLLPDCVAAIGLRAMARPVRSLLGPHAHDRAGYVEASKKGLQKMVAQAVFDAGDLPHLTEKAPSDEAIATAQAALADARANVVLLQSALASSTTRVADLELLSAAASQRVAALEQSTSWRVTAPLRAAAKVVRGSR